MHGQPYETIRASKDKRPLLVIAPQKRLSWFDSGDGASETKPIRTTCSAWPAHQDRYLPPMTQPALLQLPDRAEVRAHAFARRADSLCAYLENAFAGKKRVARLTRMKAAFGAMRDLGFRIELYNTYNTQNAKDEPSAYDFVGGDVNAAMKFGLEASAFRFTVKGEITDLKAGVWKTGHDGGEEHAVRILRACGFYATYDGKGAAWNSLLLVADNATAAEAA